MDEQVSNLMKALFFAVLACFFIGVGTNWWVGVGLFFGFTSVTYILELYIND